MSNALSDPLMVMRVRDGLSALAYLRQQPEIYPARVVVTGCGMGGIVALHVAAIADVPHAVVVWDTLASFEMVLEAEGYDWPADVFIPNLLLHYDLPELAVSLACPVTMLNPLDAMRKLLPDEAIQALNQRASRAGCAGPIYQLADGESGIVDYLRKASHSPAGEHTAGG